MNDIIHIITYTHTCSTSFPKITSLPGMIYRIDMDTTLGGGAVVGGCEAQSRRHMSCRSWDMLGLNLEMLVGVVGSIGACK